MDALEAVLAAERAAQTTQHIKDGMAELGLPVEEEAKPDIDETIDETIDEDTDEDTDTNTETETDTETDEEQDAYEREREQERADEKADEEYLRQQEQEFEKAFSKSREGIEERIAFLEEKIDYEMITPEEEAELADLRKKVGKARNWDGVTPQFRTENRGKSHAPLTAAQRAATQAMLDMLDAAGIKTHFASEAEMNAERQKNASLDTEIVKLFSSPLKVSVVSNEDSAKILKNLEATKQKYQQNKNFSNALSDIGKALGAKQTGSSQYVTIEAKNGEVVTIRISNHNATTSNFDNNGENNGISIVISRKPNGKIHNDGNAHIVEFFYSDKALNKADGTPIADIIGALEQTMYSGEYSDPTGLAVRQEVNIPPTLLRTPQGVVYGYAKGGEIYLNRERLNANTPLHEYTHLWDTACQQKNPELWKRGVELMKQLPLWEEVKNDPNYSDLTTDDEIASEVHSRLSGKDGATLLEQLAQEAADMDAMEMTERLGVVGRLKKWLADFWHWTQDTFAPWTKSEAEQVSLDDFVRMPLADLARGVNPNEAVGRSEIDDKAQFMGSRVDKRMGEIADHYNGRELTPEQQAIVDVFSGAKDRQTIAITRTDGNTISVEMQQGNENNAGTKHSLFRHYNTSEGVLSADDILTLQGVYENGVRTESKGTVVYTLEKDGVRYRAVNDKKGGKEVFHDFYTNKKADNSKSSMAESQNTQSARTDEQSTNSSAKVDENSESAKHAEWERARFSIGQSNTPNERIAEITNELVRTLNGKGLKNKFFQFVEELQNGYILLNKVFTNLNEARVASGKKALSVGQHLETIAAGTRGRAAGMLAVFDSYGHKKAYRNVLGSVGKAFDVEQESAKEMLDDYLMARSMLERIEEARQELANNGSNKELLYRLQKADEWETAFADKYGMSAAETLRELRSECRLLIVNEKRNKCYHITVVKCKNP